MELLPVSYFYFIWFLGSLGLSLLLWQLNRLNCFRTVRHRTLLPFTVMVAMLLVTVGVGVVWRNGISEIGGGFYAYLPALAGILTFFGWWRGNRAGFWVTLALNITIGLMAIKFYLAVMDCLAYSNAYWNVTARSNVELTTQGLVEVADERIDSIQLYLAAAIIPQVILYMLLPWTGQIVVKGYSLLLSKTTRNYSKM